MACKLALQAFVPANGTAKWTRKVPALVAGKYTLRARATDGVGIRQTGLVTGQSRVIVKIAAKKKPKKKVVKKKP
jgi:hypothetical protein